jgi:GNAT superfamily N-acetyltransferase
VVVSIRPARHGDAKLIAWCMLMAGRSHLKLGVWDFIISQPERICLEFLEKLTLQGPPHMCYYSEFLVAEVDGRPAAALQGFDPLTNGYLTSTEQMNTVVKEMGLTEDDMSPGRQNLAAFMTCHPDFAEGAWVVEHVATRSEHRRMGAIEKLIEAELDKGREKGFKLAQVGYYIGNTPAERAYYKAGFKDPVEKRHPDFEALIGCPGMARLMREI